MLDKVQNKKKKSSNQKSKFNSNMENSKPNHTIRGQETARNINMNMNRSRIRIMIRDKCRQIQ